MTEPVEMGVPERSRKNCTVILQRLAEVGQVDVAAALGVSESTVSRSKDSIETVSKLMAACGLKVVPASFRCAKPELIEAAFVFAKAGLEQINQDRSMIWDEDH